MNQDNHIDYRIEHVRKVYMTNPVMGQELMRLNRHLVEEVQPSPQPQISQTHKKHKRKRKKKR